jgi:hypothetical protein
MKSVKSPKKEGELPVTKRFLDLRIQEVKGDITSLRMETTAGFTKMDARFKEQNAKFESLDSKITKMLVLLEDQNDRNRVVLDSYTTVYEKLIETNARLDKIEVRVFGAAQK